MAVPMQFPPQPWRPRAQWLRVLLLAEVVGVWGVGFYGHSLLPNIVPLHFDATGEPTSYGSKDSLVIVPIVLSIAPMLLWLIAEFRFFLIDRFPYLVNLPAIFTSMEALAPEQRSQWLNRYFEHVLELGVALTAYLLALEVAMYHSMRTGSVGQWIIVLVVGVPLVLVGWYLYRLKRLSSEIRRQLEQ